MRKILLGLTAALALAGCQPKAETVAPARDAKPVMEEFWKNTEANRFGANGALLADDIFFIDPIWGRYEGKEAAIKFLAQFEGPGDGCCTLDRLVTDGNIGWAFWTLRTPMGAEPWVGVYIVRDGKLAFYQDIQQTVFTSEQKQQHFAAFKAAQDMKKSAKTGE
jgi:steroid delta-isomerase